MTTILGISAFYHDSAAALVRDGRIVAAAQEERFSRNKNDRRFPAAAIAYCLAEAGITPDDVDFVSFYEKPLLKFDRVLETYCARAPRGFASFSNAIPSWLRDKLHVTRAIRSNLRGFSRRVLFAEHHESHAASAFFPSPFDEAAILTVDGVGEWATATIGMGRGNQLQLLHELRFPHSLGLLYSAFTHYCGFEVDSGEYKVMGLAPYGEPRFVDLITSEIVDVKADGSLWMEMSYFDYCHGSRMTSPKFHRLFGGPPRDPREPLKQVHLDIAASIQRVSEDILLKMVRHIHDLTGKSHLCMAGGVALNAVANGRILREGPFKRIWIQPAAGDAGGALGAALLVWHQLLDRPRTAHADSQFGSLLGPCYTNQQIRECLVRRGAVFRELDDFPAVCAEAARLLADRNVLGWFQGRMEFGPRALGRRSILADPRDPLMQQRLNQKIKFRESFRPFAPAILCEHAADYFEIADGQNSPYMLIVTPVQPSKRRHVRPEDEPNGLERLEVIRSEIPAVTHVDCTARLQTVDSRTGSFDALLREFYRITGCPLLVNTSFNVRDEPIVCSPEDACDCFLVSGIDALVMGQFVLLKEDQCATITSEQANRSRNPAMSTPALFAGSRLIERNAPATTRQLQIFGIGLALTSAVLVMTSLQTPTHKALWWTVTVVITGLTALHWVILPARSHLYRVIACLTLPIGWIVSHAALAVIYYGILTPIAWTLRLLRRDALQLRPNRQATTYWQQRTLDRSRERSLRQF